MKLIEILPIIRNNYLIFVTPIKYADLDKEKCSEKFYSRIENPFYVTHVKCDAKGNILYRKRTGGKLEYRIYDLSKHERTEHILTLNIEDASQTITQL